MLFKEGLNNMTAVRQRREEIAIGGVNPSLPQSWAVDGEKAFREIWNEGSEVVKFQFECDCANLI